MINKHTISTKNHLRRCCSMLVLLICSQYMMAEMTDSERLHMASIIVACNNYNSKDAAFLNETAEKMQLPELGSLANLRLEKRLDVGYSKRKAAAHALLDYAESRYGKNSVEALYCRRSDVAANSYTDLDYSIDQARKDTMYARQLKDISNDGMQAQSLKIVCELELMILEDITESVSPVRWEKLYRLEQQVIKCLNANKEASPEMVDICNYMATLKSDTSSPFKSYINDLQYDYFPDGIDTPQGVINDILTNSDYYYQKAIEYGEKVFGADAVETLKIKQSYLDYYIQLALVTYDDAYAQMQSISSQLSSTLPKDDMDCLMAKLSLWECMRSFGKEIPDISESRMILKKIEDNVGKESLSYLNALYQVMIIMSSCDIVQANAMQKEMLQLARKMFGPTSEMYGQYLLGGVNVMFNSEDQHALHDYIQDIFDFYRLNHKQSWMSIAQGKSLALSYGQYLLLTEKECEVSKIALDDLEKLAGNQSLLYAMELNEYCRTLCNSNDSTLISEAVKLSKKAVELYKSLNYVVAIPYSTLADAYMNLSQTDDYEHTLREALESYKERDLWHSYLAARLSEKLYYNGKDEEAEAYFKDAMSIFKSREDEIMGQFYALYNFLSGCYRFKGEYEEAEKILLKGKARHEENYGQYDYNYQFMIENLYNLYSYDMSNLDKADMIIQERMDVIKSNPGFALDVVTLDMLLKHLNLVNIKTPNDYLKISSVFQDIFEEANIILAKAGDDRKKVMGYLLPIIYESSIVISIYKDVEKNLLDLKNMPEYNQMDDDPKNALENYCATLKSGMEQLEDVYLEVADYLKDNHYDNVNNLDYYKVSSCLSLYYLNVDADTIKAVGYLTPFLESSNQVILSSCYNELAFIYMLQKKYDLSAKMKEKEKATSYSFYDLRNKANVDNMLCLLYYKLGQYEKALPSANAYYQNRKKMAQLNFDLMTMEEREAYISYDGGIGGQWIYALLSRFPEQLSSDAYNCLLEDKGLLLRASDRIKKAIVKSGDNTLLSKLDSLNEMNSKLKTMNATPNQQKNDFTFDMNIAKARNEIESLERDINRQTAQIMPGIETPNLERLQHVLNKEEAAVEYVFSDSIVGALVLLSDGAPIYVSLTNLYPLKQSISDLDNLPAKSKAECLYDKDKLHLYEKLWKPIESILVGKKRIFFSPTGFLNELAFAAFKCEDGNYLSDHYELHQMLSTGNLISLRDKPQETPIRKATIVGGVYYSPEQEEEEDEKTERGAIVNQFAFLPYTKQEVEDVARVMQDHEIEAHTMTGSMPAEQELRKKCQDKPQVLHLSTHGFFIKNVGNEIKENKFLSRFPSSQYASMQRSGLAFVDANRTWNGATDMEENNDGILTANEVAQMDLTSTRLAVLSACQTAVGDYSLEGVFGMHRGFKQAGVESILASLWNVNDKSTAQLMKSFYQKWLSGTPMQQSLNEAVKELRRDYPSAFYWAPFVLMDAL